MKTTQADSQRVGQPSGGDSNLMRKVTAIVRTSVLETVERRLQELRVPGMTVTRVKGYGEYQDFFTPDHLVEHAQIEVFLGRDRADDTARAIVEAARTGMPGDGIVAVLPVESVYQIRTGHLVTANPIREGDADSSPPGTPARGR